ESQASDVTVVRHLSASASPAASSPSPSADSQAANLLQLSPTGKTLLSQYKRVPSSHPPTRTTTNTSTSAASGGGDFVPGDHTPSAPRSISNTISRSRSRHEEEMEDDAVSSASVTVQGANFLEAFQK